MTAPIPHGYPDFGRFIAGADKLIANVTDNNIGAPINYGPLFVGDIPFVRFNFRAFVNNFDVSVNFYEDEAFTTLLGTEFFSANALDIYDQAFPALGPFMQVTVSPTAAASSFTMRAVAAHALWRPGDASHLTVVPFNAAAAVHPNGVTNLDVVYTVPGPAVFHGQCSTASTQMDLQGINAQGTVFHLTRIHNVDGIISRPLFLPRMHLRLKIDNQSGGNGTFMYAVTRQYGGVQ